MRKLSWASGAGLEVDIRILILLLISKNPQKGFVSISLINHPNNPLRQVL